MQFGLFLNYNQGQCREAMDLYARVFGSEVKNVMTYGETPEDPNMPIKESDKDLIMYGEVNIAGMDVMFMDVTDDYPMTVGDNITPTIAGIADEAELRRIFDALKEGGKVHVEPMQMFFAPLYAMVQDRFGVIWQLMLSEA